MTPGIVLLLAMLTEAKNQDSFFFVRATTERLMEIDEKRNNRIGCSWAHSTASIMVMDFRSTDRQILINCTLRDISTIFWTCST